MASGFFYEVGAKVDKASFATATNELGKLKDASQKLISGIAGVAKSVISTAQIAGEVSTQELKMAKAIGVSSETLASFATSANMAGASASGLIGALAGIEQKMQRLKTGSVDMGLAKNLAFLGIGYNDFANMSAEQRMSEVFSQAESMKDQRLAAQLVSDTLGSAGREYYDSLKLSGKTLSQQLAESRQLNFVSERNRKESMLFANEIKGIKSAGASILQFFGARLGSAMLPIVRNVKTWIISNHDLITKSLSGIAETTAQTFGQIFGFISKVAPVVSGLITRFGGLDSLLIKVGIGFASIKVFKFVQGIKQIIGSVNMLKAGFGGLLAGGMGLIFEDIMYHFMPGKKSFIFDYILPKLDELKDKMQAKLKDFGIDIDFDKIAEGAKRLGEAITDYLGSIDWNKIGKGLADAGKKLADFVAGFAGDSWTLLQSAVRNIENLDKVISALFNKDWKGAKENLKAFWEEFKVGWNTQEATESAKNVYDEVLKKTGSKLQAADAAADAYVRNIPIIGRGYSALADSSLNKSITEKIKSLFSGGGNKPDRKVDDAIISPSGQITALSPQDWVFALKDVSNLANGLLPQSVSSTMTNAPASYTINQSYTVNGGQIEAVRAQSYKGTMDALKATIANASRIRQLMPGGR